MNCLNELCGAKGIDEVTTFLTETGDKKMIQHSSALDTSFNRVLLSIDNNELVHQKIREVFDDCFGRIFGATKVADAEIILRAIPVTCVLCDLDMEGAHNGLSLTNRWRKMYSGISRVCIFTGRQMETAGLPKHVDCSYFKGDPLYKLKSSVLTLDPNTDIFWPRTGGAL